MEDSMESNKTAGIVAGIVAVVVIIGGIVWFTNRQDTKEQEAKQETVQQVKEAKDIVATAAATESLSTLVTAVKAAGLVETLQGQGPFTVFAPTNDAFAKLPAGTLDTLLRPENVEQLKSILTYHVVSGKVLSKDLSNGQVVKTVNGQDLTVEITDGMVYLVDANGGKAKVVTADIETKNGVVHVVDAVVLPKS
jgi:uncharacterized surface protein with fasciclin (FAS1) repeats